MEQTDNLFMQYIDTHTNSVVQRNLRGMYRWIKIYEQEQATQLGQMTTAQLIEMIDAQKSATPNTIRNWILVLKGFFEWQTQYHIRADSPAACISVSDIDLTKGCMARYFKNYTELFELLSRLWNPDEGFHVFPISVLAWLGIPKSDAETLKKNQVALEKRVIISQDGSMYHLTDTMEMVLAKFEQFETHTRTNHITMTRPHYTDLFMCRWDWRANDLLGAPLPVDVTATMGAASKILKAKLQREFFTYDNIAKAGALNKMYRTEVEGEPEGVVLQAGYPILRAPRAYPSDTKIIYNAYKKAFGLK